MSVYTIEVELNGETFYRHFSMRSTAQQSFDRLNEQLSNRMRSIRMLHQESRKRPKVILHNRWTFAFHDDLGSTNNA